MDRDHTFTSFQRYLGPIYRDADGPRDIHSLNYPYGGLVVEVIDAPDADAREQLLEWLRREQVPRRRARRWRWAWCSPRCRCRPTSSPT